MKRFFRYLSFAALAAAVLCSCTKTEQPAAIEDGYGTLNLTVEGLRTRADISSHTESLAYETAVNSLYVGVFGDDGMLDWSSSSMTTGTPQAATVRTGTNITIVAVANYPTISQLTACKSLSELNAKTVLLSDNSTDPSVGFVKSGRVSGISLSKDGAVSQTVTLTNLLSRLVLTYIEVDLYDWCDEIIDSDEGLTPKTYDTFDFYDEKPFHITGAFIANVCGGMNLAGQGQNSYWYNVGGYNIYDTFINPSTEAPDDTDAGELCFSYDCEFHGTECGAENKFFYYVQNGADYETPCCVNYLDHTIEIPLDPDSRIPTGGSSTGMDWDDCTSSDGPAVLYCYAPPASFPDHTPKLIVAIEFESPAGTDIVYYYPVDISAIEPGNSYNVQLYVRRLGTLDPDTNDWAPYINLSPGGDDDTPGGDIIIEW